MTVWTVKSLEQFTDLSAAERVGVCQQMPAAQIIKLAREDKNICQ